MYAWKGSIFFDYISNCSDRRKIIQERKQKFKGCMFLVDISDKNWRKLKYLTFYFPLNLKDSCVNLMSTFSYLVTNDFFSGKSISIVLILQWEMWKDSSHGRHAATAPHRSTSVTTHKSYPLIPEFLPWSRGDKVFRFILPHQKNSKFCTFVNIREVW